MKYCANCGKEVKEGSKFCNSCGAITATGEVPNQQVDSPKSDQVINLSSINIDKERLSKMSNGYFSYFKTTLVKPSESFHETASINGVIHFVLLSLIQVISLWFLSLDSYSYQFVSMSFGTLLGLLLALVLVNFLSVFVVHGVKKVAYKSTDSFLATSTQYGGLFTALIVLQGIIMLLSLISSEEFAVLISILYLLSLVISVFAFVNYVYKSETLVKIDKFYIGIIAALVLFIVWFIVARIGAAAMMTVVEDIVRDSLF